MAYFTITLSSSYHLHHLTETADKTEGYGVGRRRIHALRFCESCKNLVDDSPRLRLLCGHEEIAIGIVHNVLKRFS